MIGEDQRGDFFDATGLKVMVASYAHYMPEAAREGMPVGILQVDEGD